MQIRCLYDKLVPISELTPHPKNRNQHPDDQIDRLAKILKYQGWRYPIKVSKQTGLITSGHGRLEAAKKNGWTQVPVNYQDYENETQEYADLQADNAIASWAELELAKINLDLPELGPDFDLEMLGLKDFELEPADKFHADEDEVPEPPKEPISKLGDLYELRNHRVLCGDSTKREDVDRLMDGQKAELWLTDPPYGVDIKAVSQERYADTGRGSTQSSKPEISNDIASKDDWKQILGGVFFNAEWACSNQASHYVFTCQGSDKQMMMMMMMQEAGWNFRHELIWKKNRFILGRSDYHYQHEPILYGWKEKGSHVFYGGRDKSSVIETQVYKNELHPTMKPIELLEQLAQNSTEKGMIVLDTFLGSGSTLIACEKTNRKCFGMEIDPLYIDVIVSRWCKFTGTTKIKRNGEEIEWLSADHSPK